MAIRYPSDFGSDSPATDYIKIQFLRRNYKSSGVEYDAEGQTIVLNMPQKITEGSSQNFAHSGLGELGQLKPFGNRQGVGGGYVLNALKRASENTALSGAVEMMNKLGASQLSENGILSGSSGIIFNPQLEVLYEGPTFRRFNFQFSLLTKSSSDARAIKAIVDELRFRSLPSTGVGQISGKDTNLDSLFSDIGVLGAGASIGGAVGQAVQGQFTNAINTLIGGVVSGAGYTAASLATGSGAIFSGDGRFIKQPPFVYLQFMRGADRHPFIPSLLPASLDQVNFDFTPTGNYTQLANYAEATSKTLATTIGVTITIQLTEVTNLFQESLTGDGFQPRTPTFTSSNTPTPAVPGQSLNGPPGTQNLPGTGPSQPNLGLPGV